MVDISRKVEVTFFVPGIGVVKEAYDMGYAEHLLCWAMNERLTLAIQTNVKVLESAFVTASMARQIGRSRAGMKPYIDGQLAAARQRAARGALSGA